MTKTLDVEGMTCTSGDGVTNALKGLAGVSKVQVDLATKKAVVEGTNLDDGAMKMP